MSTPREARGNLKKKADFPKAVLPTLTKKHTKPGRLSLKEKKTFIIVNSTNGNWY